MIDDNNSNNYYTVPDNKAFIYPNYPLIKYDHNSKQDALVRVTRFVGLGGNHFIVSPIILSS